MADETNLGPERFGWLPTNRLEAILKEITGVLEYHTVLLESIAQALTEGGDQKNLEALRVTLKASSDRLVAAVAASKPQ
jgi:hypothetical protein